MKHYNPFIEDIDMAFAKNDPCIFAEEILEYSLENHQREWLNLYKEHKRLLIIASRGHYKTTTISYIGELWEMITRPYWECMLITYSNSQVKKQFKELTNMAMNCRLINDMIVKSTTDNIKFSNGSEIYGKSIGSAVRTWHPNRVVCDDMINPRSQYSMDSIKDFINSDIQGMMTRKPNYLTFVGTPLTYDDIYVMIENDKKDFVCKKYPAIIDEDNKTVLCENVNTYEELMNIKNNTDNVSFHREYLVRVVDDATSLFPFSIVSKSFSERDKLNNSPITDGRYAMGVDLSISETGGDYTVWTIIQVLNNGMKKIAWIQKKRGMSYHEQFKLTKHFSELFKCFTVGIESNNFQRIFGDELIRTTDIPINEQIVGSTDMKKHDMIFRVRQQFENNKIIMPRAKGISLNVTSDLVHELLCFGVNPRNGKLQGVGAHDDCVLSLAHCLEAIANAEQRVFNIPIIGSIGKNS